jgi:hypothetical protein
MSVEIVTRGNVIEFSATFLDENGDPVTPTSASVFVNYRTSETDGTARDTIEIELDEDSDGNFTGSWATEDAAAGRVFWSVRANDPDAAEDGVIKLRANPANPDPATT